MLRTQAANQNVLGATQCQHCRIDRAPWGILFPTLPNSLVHPEPQLNPLSVACATAKLTQSAVAAANHPCPGSEAEPVARFHIKLPTAR